MYALTHKTENAHEDSVWTCAWGSMRKKSDAGPDNENSRDSMRSNEDETREYIVTGSVDDSVKVWQVSNGGLKLKHKLTGHSLGVVSVAVNSDGTKCASSSLDSSLRLWDLDTGEKVSSIDVGPVDIWTVVFSPDDKFIVSGSHAGKIHLYGTESGKQEQTLDTRGGKFTLSVAYSPDGKYIASGAIDGIINIFDVVHGKVLRTLEGHAMPIRSLSFSPDSQLLLTASDDGHMKLYDIKDANVAGTLSGHASWVLGVAFAPDGQKFASSSSDHTVKVWELAQRQCLHTFNEHNDQVWGVKYSPDKNNMLVSVSEDKSINLYDCPV
ncbi:WD repeat-containing protein 61-like [Neodiprion virginianus]|uniref:WD repeat-containing protein 61 n=1 Tax=Neodiprion lecontei TaxID=441921 RepID=A0ABM3FMG9_NEOLC|nr:WD repeat-containing protein 61-like [Neodiprion fabricii]XP_046589207.1 WD repeat-containing protein 61 [Neodiprion lecontei]XP_046615466.1 WD repeat-containing protein 61-like [Neodiprion virginianus]